MGEIITHCFQAARHKTNANYENLVSDKVEKRMTKIITSLKDLVNPT